jgi:heat shock protein HslJ
VVFFALASLLLVPSVVAGPATPTATASGIPPVIWEVVSFRETENVPVTIAEPWRYTVQFLPNGRLRVRLDCNRGGGGYTAAAGVLALTPLTLSEALCALDSADTRVQTLLERATSYVFDPDGSLLLHGDNGSLHLRPALTGVRWVWQTFQGSDGTLVRPEDPTQYTVAFLPDGTLTIQAACHHAGGPTPWATRRLTCGSASAPRRHARPRRSWIASCGISTRSRPMSSATASSTWPCRWTPASTPSLPPPLPRWQRRPLRDDRSGGSCWRKHQGFRLLEPGLAGAPSPSRPGASTGRILSYLRKCIV